MKTKENHSPTERIDSSKTNLEPSPKDTELKTLNELKFASDKYTKRKIKEEAIKWVKYLQIQQHIYRHNRKTKCQCPKCRQIRYTIKWISGFFNLTEENLK